MELTLIQGLMLAGTAVSAIGQISAARDEANAMEYNAEVAQQNAVIAEQNALREREAAALEESRQRDNLRRQIGSANVARAKSGITMAGSSLFVEDESMIQGELDALLIRHKGDLAANNFKTQAAQQRVQAKFLNRNASQTRTSGLLNAAGTVLTGYAASGMKSPFAGSSKISSGWNPATQPKYVA